MQSNSLGSRSRVSLDVPLILAAAAANLPGHSRNDSNDTTNNSDNSSNTNYTSDNILNNIVWMD